jgi:hypothetical protein
MEDRITNNKDLEEINRYKQIIEKQKNVISLLTDKLKNSDNAAHK